MKKFFSAAVCAVLSLSTLCACGESENVAMEDLEYGATMRQLIDTNIDICFDGRYFSDEEMKAVSNYYYAVQEKDTELFSSVQSELYIDYIEKNSQKTVGDFLEGIHSENASAIGEGYEYVYIEAIACGDGRDDLEIDEIKTLMNTVYSESGKQQTFEETIVSAKYAVLDLTAEVNGSGYTYPDQKVYIFNCTDGIYIFT